MIKDYYPKIYKELLKVNKTKNSNTKWTKHLSRHLTKDIDGKSAYEKMFNIIYYWGLANTNNEILYMPVRMAKIQTTTTKC